MKVPNTVFLDMNCKKCGKKVKPMTNQEINETHGYKLLCPDCNSFIGWGGKKQEVKDENGIRQRSSQWTADRLGKKNCEFCLRTKDMLGPGSLEVHHKLPIDAGGPDTPDNLLVLCTACHKQAHFFQCYFNKHLTKYFGGGHEQSS